MDDGVISEGEIGRICARNRHQVYDLLIREFKKSGLTQKQLAERVRISEAVISRIFKRPRNLEIDTVSKLLYGVSGGALTLSPAFPSVNRKQPVSSDYTGPLMSAFLKQHADSDEKPQPAYGLGGAPSNAANSNNSHRPLEKVFA